MSSQVAALCPSVDGPNSDFLITVEQLAKRLNLSVRTVWRRNDDGKLPAPVKIGGSVRWSSQEISRWIAARCPDRTTWVRVNKETDEGGRR
jgi:excisionase family DNA binding protein